MSQVTRSPQPATPAITCVHKPHHDQQRHTNKECTMIGLIVSLIVIGLIAGALARLLVPGRQDMSVPMTILIGIIGSFVGGFLGYLMCHRDGQDGFFQPSGIIGSV